VSREVLGLLPSAAAQLSTSAISSGIHLSKGALGGFLIVIHLCDGDDTLCLLLAAPTLLPVVRADEATFPNGCSSPLPRGVTPRLGSRGVLDVLGVDAIYAAFTVLHKIRNACTRDCRLCCRVCLQRKGEDFCSFRCSLVCGCVSDQRPTSRPTVDYRRTARSHVRFLCPACALGVQLI